MVVVSDGKTQPEPVRIQLTMELLILQRMDTSTPPPVVFGPPVESKVSLTYKTHRSTVILKEKQIQNKERMVQITRKEVGGLGLSIKGGAEHKLPILISRIYKDQAADLSGKLFVGDAVIKVSISVSLDNLI